MCKEVIGTYIDKLPNNLSADDMTKVREDKKEPASPQIMLDYYGATAILQV